MNGSTSANADVQVASSSSSSSLRVTEQSEDDDSSAKLSEFVDAVLGVEPQPKKRQKIATLPNAAGAAPRTQRVNVSGAPLMADERIPAFVAEYEPQRQSMVEFILRHVVVSVDANPMRSVHIMEQLVARGMKLVDGSELYKKNVFGIVLSAVVRGSGHGDLQNRKSKYKLAVRPLDATVAAAAPS